MNELYHYGVKGMRWGVWNDETRARYVGKYQNKDGSLTEEGKKALEDYKKSELQRKYSDFSYNSRVYKNAKSAKEKLGIHKIDRDTEIIPKTTEIGRATDTHESVDHKRKYVYITDADRDMYQDTAARGYLPLDPSKGLYFDTYSPKRDLKVASSEAVFDYLYSKNKDRTVNDLIQNEVKYINKGFFGIYDSLKDVPVETIRNDYKDHELMSPVVSVDLGNSNIRYSAARKWAMARTNAGRAAVSHVIGGQSSRAIDNSETFKHFMERGYDAMVDVEDSGINEYPVIILDPVNSIDLKGRVTGKSNL